MNFCRSLLLVITLVAITVPAVAWESVDVTATDYYITRWVTYRGTPTPGYCSWPNPLDPLVPSFQVTNADGETNMLGCADPWSFKCDTDSLVCRGAWPAHSAATIENTNFESLLTCTVNITAETGMYCTRSAVGNLDEEEHRLTLEHPGGELVTIFPLGPGPDDVQLVLAPGTYQVSMVVFAKQILPPSGTYDPYTGHVLVMWGDPNGVAVEHTSWSSLKAIFR